MDPCMTHMENAANESPRAFPALLGPNPHLGSWVWHCRAVC